MLLANFAPQLFLCLAGSFATSTASSTDPAIQSSSGALPSTFITSISITPTSIPSATPSIKSGFQPENLSKGVQIGFLVGVLLFGIAGIIAAFIVFAKAEAPRIDPETVQVQRYHSTAEGNEEERDGTTNRQDLSWLHNPYVVVLSALPTSHNTAYQAPVPFGMAFSAQALTSNHPMYH
ncbi:hypothetical protein PVAG01_00270 [Phlyctema vagabunda]|uniref:Uncharacterized protein n=1 Tax=Phlyctema vagabunda TaxID=108571 RepID=A0ABR4PU29_9HELO